MLLTSLGLLLAWRRLRIIPQVNTALMQTGGWENMGDWGRLSGVH